MLIDIHTHNLKPGIKSIYVCEDLVLPHDTTQSFCIGVHPWHSDKFTQKQFVEVLEVAKERKSFFAIGEIGLDKLSGPSLKQQIVTFESQLKIAIQIQCPRIIIHCVRLHAQVFESLINMGYKGKVLFHDYNSTIEMAKQYTNHFDCYFSFGARLFNKKPRVLNVLNKLPIERIFFETDDSKEYNIEDIYNIAAKELNLDLSELKTALERNLCLFSDINV